MAFTTKEFPGRVFKSIEEYETFKIERESLKNQFFLGTVRAKKLDINGKQSSQKTNDLEEE